MDKINIAIFIIISAVVAFASSYNSNEGNNKSTSLKKYDKTKLLGYITTEDIIDHDFYLSSWSSSYPLLKPERFRRRMKMLFAIDVNNYPKNSLIKIEGWGMPNEDEFFKGKYIHLGKQEIYVISSRNDDISNPGPFGGMEDNMYEDYGEIILDYLFYDDLVALDSIKTYKYRVCIEALGENWKNSEVLEELLSHHNIIYEIYNYIHTTKPELIQYADKNKELLSYGRCLKVNYTVGDFYRASSIRRDIHLIHIMNEKKNNRPVTCNYYDSSLDIGITVNNTDVSFFYYFDDCFPWQKETPTQSITEYMSFLVQLQEKEFNKYVIQYMSGQLDSDEGAPVMRDQIRSNNYYGHAVLREFCENPEREMPTLEKVGTSFNGKVIQPKTLLYLEPYPDSYDIDTIQQTEIFKAYEMGYDDYYFVEVVKPVESPVKGSDGYAMILDRKETVYGYIRKSEVKEVSELEI